MWNGIHIYVYISINADFDFPDEPIQRAAAEIAEKPKEALPSKPTPPTVAEDSDAQRQSSVTTEASHQGVTVDDVTQRVSLPPVLTDTQGQSDTHLIFQPLTFYWLFLVS